MKQDESEQYDKKGPTPVVGKNPNGKSRLRTKFCQKLRCARVRIAVINILAKTGVFLTVANRKFL